ncbi:hypothetical protein J6590_031136 [Homalodisca vitripennis]|nr:hypothetical protein J6590_031136 [Homalodisca vitripennis]
MNIDWTPVKKFTYPQTGGTARLPHPTSQFRYQTLPSAMRASLIAASFVLSSPYHSSGPTPSTGRLCQVSGCDHTGTRDAAPMVGQPSNTGTEWIDLDKLRIGVHHLRLLHILGRLALILFLPVWLFYDFRNVINESIFVSKDKYRIIALLLTDGVLSWLQNILAFSVMSLVTSLTYAVASASKRIFVIGASLLVLGNPVTGTNVFGMGLAILGVLCYNKAKYDARQEEKQKTLLPFSSKSWEPNGVPYSSLPSYEPYTVQDNSHSSLNNNGKSVHFV